MEVRRNGIVNKSVHATGCKMMLQGIEVGTENRENVPHGIVPQFGQRRSNARVGDTIYQHSSHLAAASVIGIEVAQFHAEGSRVQFVHAAVASTILKYIFTRRAIVGNGTNGIGKAVIVGSHCTGIAKCAEILSGIEAVCSSITKRPCKAFGSRLSTRESAAVGLGIVFDDLQDTT